MTRTFERAPRRGRLAAISRRPSLSARLRPGRWTWTGWMPDLDDPIRVAHEKTWGLMALAGASLAGGVTLVSFEQPELGVWLAALLGAFGGVLLLPLIAILVRLSVFLALGGVVVAVLHYFLA